MQKRETYHHGDLRVALVAAAEQIIVQDGIEGFSLRKATARAGVSAGAAGYHFSGVRDLLTAVAIHAYAELGLRLKASPETSDAARDLRARATVYIEYALANRGLFLLIGRMDLVEYDSEQLGEASFQALTGLVAAAARYCGVDYAGRDRHATQPGVIGILGTVHGLAHMALEGRLSLVSSDDDPQGKGLLSRILEETWK